MIIILSTNKCSYHLYPKDTITVLYDDIVLSKIEADDILIIKSLTVFMFAEDDGTCLSPNISFTLSEILPKELLEAKRVDQLSIDQLLNLAKSCPFKILK